eukprot:23414_4
MGVCVGAKGALDRAKFIAGQGPGRGRHKTCRIRTNCPLERELHKGAHGREREVQQRAIVEEDDGCCAEHVNRRQCYSPNHDCCVVGLGFGLEACRHLGAPKSASGVVRCAAVGICAAGSLSIFFCTVSNDLQASPVKTDREVKQSKFPCKPS